MAKFRDFGSPVSQTDSEPIAFKLYDEEFKCRAQIPGKVMLDFAARSADQENAAANATVLTDFFKFAMFDESYARFEQLCTDNERIVTIEQLASIVEWLTEIYAERPTQRPVA